MDVYFLLLFSCGRSGKPVYAGDQIFQGKQTWPAFGKQTRVSKYGLCYCWGSRHIPCRASQRYGVYLSCPLQLKPSIQPSKVWLAKNKYLPRLCPPGLLSLPSHYEYDTHAGEPVHKLSTPPVHFTHML